MGYPSVTMAKRGHKSAQRVRDNAGVARARTVMLPADKQGHTCKHSSSDYALQFMYFTAHFCRELADEIRSYVQR